MNNELKHDIEAKVFFELLKKKDVNAIEKKINDLNSNFPNDAVLMNICGFVYAELNYYEKAIIFFKKSIFLDKGLPYPNYNLGLLYFKKNNFTDAINFFLKNIKLKKDYYEAYLFLAECYKKKKYVDKAIETLQNAIKIKPKKFDAYNNLGILYIHIHNYSKAKKNFQKVLEIFPDMFGALNNIGLIYIAIKDFEVASDYFLKAIKIKKDYFEAYGNLALSLLQLKDYKNALINCEKSIQINKNFIKGYWVLSLILKKLGKFKDALIAAERCIEINKKYYPAYGQLITLCCETFQHKKAKEYFEYVLKMDEEDIFLLDLEDLHVLIFYSNYISDFSHKDYEKLTKFSEIFFGQKKNKDLKKYSNTILKIGFLSADFKSHAVMYQLKNVFFELKKRNDEVEIFAFNNTFDEDKYSSELKGYFKSFIDIKMTANEDLINLITDNKIDVLIDLSGYTTGNRLEVFHHRAAPVQITWCGYLASTGLQEMDYIIADNYTIPKYEEKKYSEKVLRLESWSLLTDILDEKIIGRDPPCKKNKFVTFGCLNNISKINFKVLELWSQLLIKVDGSKLIIKNHLLRYKEQKELIIYNFKKFGVKESSLDIRGPSERNHSLLVYNDIDIVLDPFPYGGGTTNLEAASMCVPILTKAGNSFISRCGESVNYNLNMQEWIAKDEADYLKKGVYYSTEENLIKVKKHLFDLRNKTIIFSPKRFVDQFIFELKKILNKC